MANRLPLFAALLPALFLLGGRELAAFQEPPLPDSAAMVREARERQAAFERFRASQIPVQTRTPQGGCDERIGRICIWFGGEGEADFPAELATTRSARGEFIDHLEGALRELPDSWMAGQLVFYLAEAGRLREAERIGRECTLVERWWCAALLGYVMHLDERFPEAESAFAEAVAGLPLGEREGWMDPGALLTPAARRELEALPADEAAERIARLWRFSDPLFLVPGNDRLTEHYARLVEVRIQEGAENPYGLRWEEDLAETVVRYGRNIGYSRVQRPPGGLGSTSPSLIDTRQVIGHHHPLSRGYLFPEVFLAAPADIPPESWITAPREAREWYAPPYAPDVRALETQVARFRRGRELLLVASYQPEPIRTPTSSPALPAVEASSDPFGSRRAPPAPAPASTPAPSPVPDWGIRGGVRTGLFLIAEDGGEPLEVLGSDVSGVLTLRAPAGRYVTSLELWNEGSGRAWRARQGVAQSDLPPGLVAASDLLLLREGAEYPETIEEAISAARPGVRIRLGERFVVAWEVYGVGIQEPVEVTLGFTRGRPGFLQRVGEFLGLVEPERPVEIRFNDTSGDVAEVLFRAVALQLPPLPPGEYTLHLRLDLPGREPVTSSRPILLEP